MKHQKPAAPWVWVDLEMSGLDIGKDVILEIACIITDSQLNIIAQQSGIAIVHAPEIIQNLDEWNTLHHTQSGLIEDLRQAKTTLAHAEQQVLTLIQQHCAPQKSPLCGNSIWMDRQFLAKYMPSIINYLHYRTIDVSTIKLLVTDWYGFNESPYKKKNSHRAFQDIQESINELAFYRKQFFKNK